MDYQKQTMKRAFLDYLGAASMLFVMAIAVLVVGLLTEDISHFRQIVFVATPCVFLHNHTLCLLFPPPFCDFSKTK